MQAGKISRHSRAGAVRFCRQEAQGRLCNGAKADRRDYDLGTTEHRHLTILMGADNELTASTFE
jgi:hypothetical protein